MLIVVAGWVLSGAGDAPDFNRDVKPILANRCFACHGPDDKHREAGLRLDDRAVAIKKLTSENTAVVPGKPAESELLRRVRADDADERMPPKGAGEPLSAKEIAVLERWIAAGAVYAPHWSYVAPRKSPPPNIAAGDRDWALNPIDAFTLIEMRKRGLAPSPQAERGILLRRVGFDLIGLPPTKEQLDEFLRDDEPGAFERAADRLLGDPGFGERWARVWLDLARYADSAGYGSDPLRPTIWRYRDWAIAAHNRNMPFDEFTKVQLAGDLRPKPSLDELIATAFHRNTMTNTEGGTDDEEFRVAAVKDRTDVTMQVWMGLTVGCAKCHSHKFDPISHQEYYQLFAFFNQTADVDLPNETPTIPAPTADERRASERIDGEIARLRAKLKEQTPEIAGKQKDWEEQFATAPGQDWKPLTVSTTIRDKEVRWTAPAMTGTTAVRVEAPTSPGDWANAAFNVESTSVENADEPVVGRIVRIDLPGENRILQLSEVEAFSKGRNLARKGTAKQSSTYIAAQAKRAIDGDRDGEFDKGSTAHTNPEANPWWEVELPADAPIDRIAVWNRTDAGVSERLRGWTLSILDAQRKVVWKRTQLPPPPKDVAFDVHRWDSVRLAAVRTGNGPLQPIGAGGARLLDAVKPSENSNSLTFVLANALSMETKRIRVAATSPIQPTNERASAVKMFATRDSSLQRKAQLPAEIASAMETAPGKRNPDQHRVVADYFREQIAGKPIRDAVSKLEATRPKSSMLPVMQELQSDKRRVTRVLEKGNFLQPGQTVTAAAPKAFHAWPPGAPSNRAGLAEWLTAIDNPLTARVAVNRLWARLFGRGLVETEEDFGIQGEHPSNPELLDWLANELVRCGWDTKSLLRLIVASATYRQSTKTAKLPLEKDPDNRWLSRFPRLRLEAEMVRDQALALSGRLVSKIGGPSVYPPQPDGLWQAAFNGERTWPTSANSDRYRRGLYVFWRRTIPYPSMAAFDAPSRETCTLRRKSTNTPIQAFVTLNDPVYVDLARSLAGRILREGGSTAEHRARFALRLALCREPSGEQIAVVVRLVENAMKSFNVDDANKWGGEPPAGVSPQMFAAWTLAANALLNLDGVLTKG